MKMIDNRVLDLFIISTHRTNKNNTKLYKL